MKKAYSEYDWGSTESKNTQEYCYNNPTKAVVELVAFSESKNEHRVNGFDNETIETLKASSSVESWIAEYIARRGDCQHFFFQGYEFMKWLESCHSELDEDMVSIPLLRKAVKVDHSGQFTMPFMFHYEKGNSPCYLCRWVFREWLNENGLISRCAHLVIGRGSKIAALQWFPFVNGILPEHENDVKLCAASLCYLQAFPDMVKIGIPDNLKHAPRYKDSACFDVSVSPSLVVHGSPVPHYRSGHFRYLKSERFTKMRGKTIFVHGVFVKGKAQTVVSPDYDN